MRKNKKDLCKLFTYISLLLLLFTTGCRPKAATDTETVSIDEKFKSVFYSDSEGISAADGLFSIPLPDGSSVFLLGDCFIGKAKDSTLDINTIMLRNAFNLINKDNTRATAIIRGTYDNPLTLMEPINEPGDTTCRWYWPAHGFIKDDTIYVFALSLFNYPYTVAKEGKTKDEKDELTKVIFSFKLSHIDLLSFSYPELKHLETHKVEFDYPANQIDFGNCVMVDKGYIYVYGTKNYEDISKIHIARVPFSSHSFYKDWEYFTGKTWDKDISRSEPLDIDIPVSEQFSIFRYRNKYILLTQEKGGADIYTYISDFPNKDFHNKQFVYHTIEAESDTNKFVFSYNALAHKQYIENNQLLVSYCVNSLNTKDLFDNIDNYRARFLRVPMSLILREKKQK